MSEQKPIGIPAELTEQLRAGNVVLFLGDGINHGVGGVVGMPTHDEVIDILVTRCGYPAGAPHRFPLVAQYYEERRGRDSLINDLRDLYLRPDLVPGANLRTVARLPVWTVVSTCYDDLIERALEQASPRRPYVRIGDKWGVVDKFRITALSPAKTAVIKLWGDVRRPSSLILTEEDREKRVDPGERRGMREHAASILGAKVFTQPWIFCGCDLVDPWLRDFLNRTRLYHERQFTTPEAYAFDPVLSAQVRDLLSQRHISVIDMDASDGLAALEEAVQGAPHRLADAEREQVQTEPEGTEWQADADLRRAERDEHVAQQDGRGRAESGGSVAQTAPPDKWDVFISHAWEDKETIARPLAQALEAQGLRVWFDEYTLTVGDRLRRSVDRGLANCRYGIVILSPMFFAKEWPQKELDGLVQRENKGEKVILPVWHNMSAEQIAAYSLPLADRIAVLSSRGLDQVVAELLRAMGREPSE